MRRLLFNGMFGLHIQLTCHLVAIISEKIIIQRLIVSGNGTPDGRGMCRENRGNLRYIRL